MVLACRDCVETDCDSGGVDPLSASQELENRQPTRSAMFSERGHDAVSVQSSERRAVKVVDTWNGRRAVLMQRALRLSNEAFAEHLGVATRTVAAWHSQHDVEPSPVNQAALDTALLRADEATQLRLGLLIEQSDTDSFVPESMTRTDSLLLAAHEASTDELLLATGVGAEAVDHLKTAAIRLADDYNSIPPFAVFFRARELRDAGRRLVEAARRPSLLADLYLVISKVTALMGSAAFDLEFWESAASFGRSASTYADLAGHNAVGAWSHGLAATLAFWRDDADQALEYVAAGRRLRQEVRRECVSFASPRALMRCAETGTVCAVQSDQPRWNERPP